MSFDLTIYPGDWLLGIWWAEFGPGISVTMPNGGHWMLLIRRTHGGANPDVAIDPDAWYREEAVRAVDRPGWSRSATVVAGLAADQHAHAESRTAWVRNYLKGEGLRIIVHGRGERLCRALESGAKILPDWLSLQIVELSLVRAVPEPRT